MLSLTLLYIQSRNQTTHIIALHFPGASKGTWKMHKHNAQREPHTHSFVAIQVSIRGNSGGDAIATEEAIGGQIPEPRPKLNLSSAMKLFHRFRKVLMRLMLSVPSSSSRRRRSSDSRHRNPERFEPPRTSFSSYYSSYSHYNEAIADCIEFFNKSAEDGILDGRKSDVV